MPFRAPTYLSGLEAEQLNQLPDPDVVEFQNELKMLRMSSPEDRRAFFRLKNTEYETMEDAELDSIIEDRFKQYLETPVVPRAQQSWWDRFVPTPWGRAERTKDVASRLGLAGAGIAGVATGNPSLAAGGASALLSTPWTSSETLAPDVASAGISAVTGGSNKMAQLLSRGGILRQGAAQTGLGVLEGTARNALGDESANPLEYGALGGAGGAVMPKVAQGAYWGGSKLARMFGNADMADTLDLQGRIAKYLDQPGFRVRRDKQAPEYYSRFAPNQKGDQKIAPIDEIVESNPELIKQLTSQGFNPNAEASTLGWNFSVNQVGKDMQEAKNKLRLPPLPKKPPVAEMPLRQVPENSFTLITITTPTEATKEIKEIAKALEPVGTLNTKASEVPQRLGSSMSQGKTYEGALSKIKWNRELAAMTTPEERAAALVKRDLKLKDAGPEQLEAAFQKSVQESEILDEFMKVVPYFEAIGEDKLNTLLAKHGLNKRTSHGGIRLEESIQKAANELAADIELDPETALTVIKHAQYPARQENGLTKLIQDYRNDESRLYPKLDATTTEEVITPGDPGKINYDLDKGTRLAERKALQRESYEGLNDAIQAKNKLQQEKAEYTKKTAEEKREWLKQSIEVENQLRTLAGKGDDPLPTPQRLARQAFEADAKTADITKSAEQFKEFLSILPKEEHNNVRSTVVNELFAQIKSGHLNRKDLDVLAKNKNYLSLLTGSEKAADAVLSILNNKEALNNIINGTANRFYFRLPILQRAGVSWGKLIASDPSGFLLESMAGTPKVIERLKSQKGFKPALSTAGRRGSMQINETKRADAKQTIRDFLRLEDQATPKYFTLDND